MIRCMAMLDGNLELMTPPPSFHHGMNSFNRAGYSITETKEVLSSIASDCMVDGGECLNAVEIFWCPSEPTEVLTKLDVITDFPEILDL